MTILTIYCRSQDVALPVEYNSREQEDNTSVEQQLEELMNQYEDLFKVFHDSLHQQNLLLLSFYNL